MNLTMERNSFFDILKGGTIFLVALVHSLQSVNPDFRTDSFYLANIMFHMPLFMLISGYFLYPSVEKSPLGTFIIKKFKRLYLPSLFWGGISVVLIMGNKLIQSKTIDFVYFADLLFTGAWFLTVLFILSIIGAFINKYFRNHTLLAWIFIYICIYILPTNVFMGNELKFLTPFFVLGLSSKKWNWKHIPIWIGLPSLMVYAICCNYFTFADTVYEMNGSPLEYAFFKQSLFRTICGLSGASLFVWLSTFMQKSQYLQELLLKIGVVTLPIYLLHQWFLQPLRFFHFTWGYYFLSVIICFIIIELSLFIYHHISKPLLRQIMFGETLKK